MQADLPAASAQDSAHGAFASLFAEELGLVLEVQSSDAASIVEAYCRAGLTAYVVGKVRASFAPLFAEELHLVLEVSPSTIMDAYCHLSAQTILWTAL